MKMKLFLSGLMLLALSLMTISCTKDEEPLPVPVAAFTPSKTTATVGEAITFTNESTDATSYTWSFGDGTTSTDAAPSKTYTAAGTFTVTLVATGAGGTNSKDQDITVLVGTEVYFIDYTDAKIAKFALSTPATVTTILDITDNNGIAIAYDAVNNKIYFSGLDATDNGGVWKINMDGTSKTNVITDLWDPYGIALNVAGNKLYVADDRHGDPVRVGNIYRTDLSGANSSAVVTQDEAQFRAVALDLTNNKMYYYEVNEENLWMANLDGTNPQVAVAGVYGYGILVDAAHSKIYFDDQNSKELKVASLTGTNVTKISEINSKVYGIAIDKATSKLYWADRNVGTIFQSNLDGTDKVSLKTGLTGPCGIFIK